MNADVELHIRNNYQWSKLPSNIRQLLGNSQKEYEKCVVQFSIRNQLRYKGSLVRHVRKDEERYYEEMLDYSRQHLMLYPYHLSDVFVRGLRVTPFQYYVSMVEAIMNAERSYDALPNFTAADCLRLLGIGRNQYIELMNQCKSARKLFRKKNPRELLPIKPVSGLVIEPWWKLYAGFITEDDIKIVTPGEKEIIDNLIDNGPQQAGKCNYHYARALYMKGLVYIEVPIEESNFISVPPLEGFVMNRVLGDYLETLLYKIFVSIDEHTSVGELASVLQIDASQVKNAVSLYCRLGFARKKGAELEVLDLDPSWKDVVTPSTPKTLSAPMPLSTEDDPLLLELSAALAESERDGSFVLMNQANRKGSAVEESDTEAFVNSIGQHTKRIAFIFDSSLTAFLMMGNLSQGLKSHAVTMFEVGKLSDESLDSLITELNRISTTDSEGEAQRYFEHALTLRHTIAFLRHSKVLGPDMDAGLDLIRCESLQSLDPPTCARLLAKNYRLLVSMAPLSNELRLTCSSLPPHWGPPLPEFSSIWFKLFLYSHSQMGPPSLLLKKGSRLRKLPRALYPYDRLLITPWSHEPGLVPITSALVIINDALTHSPVLVQGCYSELDKKHVVFPLLRTEDENTSGDEQKIVKKLATLFDLRHACGFVTLIGGGKPTSNHQACGSPKNGIKDEAAAGLLEEELNSLDGDAKDAKTRLSLNLEECVTTHSRTAQHWTLLTLDFGLPLFDLRLNEEVSDHIKDAQLGRKESLEAWVASSEKMSSQLLDFISKFQELPVGGDCHTRTGLVEVPLPTRNLLFDGEKLYPWDGQ